MKPVTEQANPRTRDIDRRSTSDIITLINNEDRCVADKSAYASNQQPLMFHVALQLLWELAAGASLRTCHPAKYGL